MKTSIRLPIFVEDKPVFELLWKKVGALAAKAANLSPDFPKLSRHAAEFGAYCCGSTNCQRLFAEVASTSPTISAGVSRQEIAGQFEAAIKRGAAKLAADGAIELDQAAAITDAATAIVRAISKDLQYLAVDRSTFERNVLDPCLVAAGAPKFEYAITSDSRAVFSFSEARRALLAAAGQKGSAAISEVSPAKMHDLLRTSTLPLIDAMKNGWLPLTHNPVIFSDEAGNVVGGSFQHAIHLGIVPVCCEDEERLWAVAAALCTPMQAHLQHGPSWKLGFEDPTRIHPYFPAGRFPSMFNAPKDDAGPPIYCSQVPMAKAVEYLKALSKAINGERVPCLEPSPQLLKGATLTSTTVVSIGASKKERTYWGLRSAQSTPGQTKVAAASGTTSGITSDSQWYLRQIYWFDEVSLPELGMRQNHFLAPQANFDITKIIPDGVEDFTRRALEHIHQMPKEQQSNAAIRAVYAKLQEQKKLLQKVKGVLEADALDRIAARRSGLTAVGSEVLSPAD